MKTKKIVKEGKVVLSRRAARGDYTLYAIQEEGLRLAFVDDLLNIYHGRNVKMEMTIMELEEGREPLGKNEIEGRVVFVDSKEPKRGKYLFGLDEGKTRQTYLDSFLKSFRFKDVRVRLDITGYEVDEVQV